MTLRQLRLLWEVVRQGNHISAAADVLHTSQPAVSKQLRALEAELGFELFVRKRNQIIRLTDLGKEVLAVARRMLIDADNLRHISEDLLERGGGALTIAATHTQARYTLPNAIKPFVARHPKLQLGLLQGNPNEVCELVDTGEADVGIGTEARPPFPNLVMLPCFELSQVIIVRKKHPLLKVKKVNLADVAKYPIIAHKTSNNEPWRLSAVFEKAGLSPKAISSAVDADVCKTYVELGFGITILSGVVFDRSRDSELIAIDANHLFPPLTTFLSVRRNMYLRGYVIDLIQTLAPGITRDELRRAVNTGEAGIWTNRKLRRL